MQPFRSVFILLILFLQMAYSKKPYLRSKLAQSAYDKMLVDEDLRKMDLSEHYEVDHLTLKETSAKKFVKLEMDLETKTFLDKCFEQSEWFLHQIWHTLAKSFLGVFMSQTSVNGLLNRGRMFVWSKEQAKVLLSEHLALPPEEGSCSRPEVNHLGSDEVTTCANLLQGDCPGGAPWWSDKTVLDLGAGDGYVTQILAEAAKEVYVTETSPVMRKKLNEKGYKVLEAFRWADEIMTYDVVTCLNLLDRCDTPLTILRDIHKRLDPEGKLVVALVLPISPYVETGTSDHEPSEDLGITGNTLEEQVNSLTEDVFPNLGYDVSHWTKLPYLCEGDLDQAFYWLSDVVFVMKKKET